MSHVFLCTCTLALFDRGFNKAPAHLRGTFNSSTFILFRAHPQGAFRISFCPINNKFYSTESVLGVLRLQPNDECLQSNNSSRPTNTDIIINSCLHADTKHSQGLLLINTIESYPKFFLTIRILFKKFEKIVFYYNNSSLY